MSAFLLRLLCLLGFFFTLLPKCWLPAHVPSCVLTLRSELRTTVKTYRRVANGQ